MHNYNKICNIGRNIQGVYYHIHVVKNNVNSLAEGLF